MFNTPYGHIDVVVIYLCLNPSTIVSSNIIFSVSVYLPSEDDISLRSSCYTEKLAQSGSQELDLHCKNLGSRDYVLHVLCTHGVRRHRPISGHVPLEERLKDHPILVKQNEVRDPFVRRPPSEPRVECP